MPSVFVYGGSIYPGQHNGKAIDIVDVFEAVGACAAGTISKKKSKSSAVRVLVKVAVLECLPPTLWLLLVKLLACLSWKLYSPCT